MSGAISVASLAAVAASVGSTAYGIYNGQQQLDAQKKALAAQNTAQ